MSDSLQNMSAVVTGASSGIGRATAALLAKRNVRIALVGRREAVLREAAEECGPLASAYLCDLGDDTQVRALVEKIRSDMLRIDILVHSAGMIKLGNLARSPVRDFDAQFAINVRAAYVLVQAILPSLRAVAGQIVLINSSITRAHKTDGRGVYAIAKHALHSFANTLRDEVNEDGIRVTTIFPGKTATPMQSELYRSAGRRYEPSRMLQPEDVAQAVLFALTAARTSEITDLYIRPMQKPC
jgi:NADP-dependent 3-hydroxy acid dehydrogenase YdfG